MSIKTAIVNGVATIEIARPEKKNALTIAMYQAMADALNAAREDAGVRAVLIAGQPGVFTSGNDIEDFMSRPPGQGSEGLDSPVFRFMQALFEFDKPVVAAVTGAAIGIGTTMLLHCDLVYVADDARLAMPFVSLGLVPEAASSLIAPRLLGHTRAFALLVMGQALNAADAKSAGLVNMVVPSDAVETEAMKAAAAIAALPPQAVLASRRLMRGEPDEIIARIDAEAEQFKARLQSSEARAAFEAFMKRKR